MPEPLTQTQLDELRELFEKTTRGEWIHHRDKLRPQFSARINEIQCDGEVPIVSWSGFDDSARAEKHHAANAAFIATVHNAFPSLLETLAEKDAEIQSWNRRTGAALKLAEEKIVALQQANERIAELEEAIRKMGLKGVEILERLLLPK